MKNTILAVFVLAIGAGSFLAGACVHSPEKKENPILGVASFDLNCPKDKLDIKVIERTVWGVRSQA